MANEDDDAAMDESKLIPDVLGTKDLVTKFGRSAYLCPAAVKTAKFRVKVKSLQQLNSLARAENASPWNIENLTLAHFHAIYDKPGGLPRPFFSVDYSELCAADRRRSTPPSSTSTTTS